MKINDEIRVGDIVRLRKRHPCGSDLWQVHRVGADIGIACRQCGRRAMLTRRRFTHSVRELVSSGEASPDRVSASGPPPVQPIDDGPASPRRTR